MEINLIQAQGVNMAEVTGNGVEIKNNQDALDLMANCGYQGADGIILRAENITPDFFDLKTGIAGEILQKFSTYNMRLAIVGDFSKFSSKSLKDFMYESNKIGRINFVGSLEEAKAKLAN
ncbi:DUF4180 domain-containing protein [Adhaeribacter swui]|uniref:DUF4180 domain-containing protein n=1 Tax=Adhaeribacter swui TaxID=2086471 RepID=A0A7G7G9P2_9BACT|nr:DUF4180 domain-containing protein [Adhaeribacter swui]QNF33876.1 DUF4180 domain-containing protein [Adhaeribacter swui]